MDALFAEIIQKQKRLDELMGLDAIGSKELEEMTALQRWLNRNDPEGVLS